MWFVKTCIVFFVDFVWGCHVYSQENPAIQVRPYTIYTTYEKLHETYSFVSPIQPLKSDKIISKENIVYRTVGNSKLKADVYTPSDTLQTYPGVLLIHGGGWISGSKENERVMAQHLAENGYVAVPLAYRLSGEAKYPAAVIDIKEAIKWFRENAEGFPVNTNKIAVLGASAGAQLATLVGVTTNLELFGTSTEISDEIQAIVNIDGIVSFTHPESEESGSASLWLGGTKNENPKNWKEASPLEYVNANTPPILFINSAQPRFHAGRDDMLKIMDSYTIYNETYTIPNAPHSFWLVHPWFETTLEYTVSFLDKTLKSKE